MSPRLRPYAPATELRAGKSLMVHSSDDTRIHTEVFGPADGYPIVNYLYAIVYSNPKDTAPAQTLQAFACFPCPAGPGR